jgi:hypothetical protein
MPATRRFPRREVNLLLNLTLVALVGLTFASGWAASLLGLTEFGLHRYSSIAMLVGVCAHVALHWRSLAAQVRRRFGSAVSIPPGDARLARPSG